MIVIIAISIILLLSAFILLAIGCYLLKDYKKLKTENFALISGTISDMVKEKNSPGSYSLISYYPVVDFIYHDISHSIKTRVEVDIRKPNQLPNGKKFAIGDSVNIRIYNGDVNTVIIDNKFSFKRGKMNGIGFLVFGSILVILWLLFLIIV